MNFSVRKMIENSLFIAVILILIAKFMFPAQVPPPVSVIESESMVPTLNKGDLVFWVPAPIEDVHVGDIVVYKSSMGNRYIVHRVIEIKHIDGEIKIVTKGDANQYPDQYGPHAVEDYVTERNLVGKLVMIGNFPLKVPYLGYAYLYTAPLLKNAVGFRAVPLSIGVIFFAAVFMGEGDEKKISRKLRLMMSMMGERFYLLRLFFITFIVFSLITSSTILFAYQKIEVCVGVDEKASGGDINVNIREGQNTTKGVWIVPSAFSDMKVVVFQRGDKEAYVGERIILVQPDENRYLPIHIVGDEKGIHHTEFYIFSSPFWIIIPDSIILSLMSTDPFIAAFLLDLIVAFIISVAVTTAMGAIFLIYHLYTRYREKKELERFIRTEILHIPEIRKKKRRQQGPLFVDGKLIVYSFFASIILFPLLFFGFLNFTVYIILASIIGALISYIYDHKTKVEISFVAAYSALFSSLLYMLNVLILTMQNLSIQMFLYSLAIALIIFSILLLPAIYTSLLAAKLAFKIEERIRPEIILESDL